MPTIDELMTELTVAVNEKAEAERIFEAAASMKGVPDALFTASDETLQTKVREMAKTNGTVRRMANELIQKADAKLGEVQRKIRDNLKVLEDITEEENTPSFEIKRLYEKLDRREAQIKEAERSEKDARSIQNEQKALLEAFIAAVEADEDGPDLTRDAYLAACKYLGRPSKVAG